MGPTSLRFFFLGFICNCLSYFITAGITFTCILYPQCTHMIFIIHTSCHCERVTTVCVLNFLLVEVAYTVHLPRIKKSVSQSRAVAKREHFWWATGQSNLADKALAATKTSRVCYFALAQRHCSQWNSFPFCLPTLIVQ